ncbi:MAG TPA: hypothetical protein VGF40_15085, partial [Thermoanaerobaculia bacterium]
GGTIGFPEISAVGTRLSESLDTFLSDTEKRPSPGELSKRVSALADELASAVDEARRIVNRDRRQGS